MRREWLVKEDKPQAVTSTVWAFATPGIEAPSLFAAVDKRGGGEWLVKQGAPQAVANTVWAAAILGMLGKNDNFVRLC
jgi:hypothetical protein